MTGFGVSGLKHGLSGYADVIEIGTAPGLQDAVFVGHSVSGMIGVLASLVRASGLCRPSTALRQGLALGLYIASQSQRTHG